MTGANIARNSVETFPTPLDGQLKYVGTHIVTSPVEFDIAALTKKGHRGRQGRRLPRGCRYFVRNQNRIRRS